jgi:hypothetical protein
MRAAASSSPSEAIELAIELHHLIRPQSRDGEHVEDAGRNLAAELLERLSEIVHGCFLSVMSGGELLLRGLDEKALTYLYAISHQLVPLPDLIRRKPCIYLTGFRTTKHQCEPCHFYGCVGSHARNDG